jgi:hypothetical protein
MDWRRRFAPTPARTGAVDFSPRPILAVPFAIALETEELSFGFLETLRATELAAQARNLNEVVVEPQVEETPWPFAEGLIALAKIAAHDSAMGLKAGQPEPLEIIGRAHNTRYDTATAIPAVAAATRMQPLTPDECAAARAARAVRGR